jgi:hypothetical protein
MESYRVRARNTAFDSENRIHDDQTAAARKCFRLIGRSLRGCRNRSDEERCFGRADGCWLGSLREQRHFFFVAHGLPGDEFFGEHVQPAKQRQFEDL